LVWLCIWGIVVGHAKSSSIADDFVVTHCTFEKKYQLKHGMQH